jgi:hypothetical protein
MFFFSFFCNEEYEFIPESGPVAGVKVAVADSTYTRASEELKPLLYLPTKLPEDGSNPRVRIFLVFH